MKIVAHRGYSGKYPELSPLALKSPRFANSRRRVRCALDARWKSSGSARSHVGPHRGRPGRISKMDWEDLRGVDIGSGQRMMLLDELLELLEGTPHHLYIETKHPSGQGDILEEQTVLRLRYAGLLTTPDPRHFLFPPRHPPHAEFGAAHGPDLSSSRLGAPRQPSRCNAVQAHRARRIVAAREAAAGNYRRAGLPTYLWTVDKPEDMKWAWANGVDMLATNQPEVALHAIEL